MVTGPQVILALKVAVGLVTLILLTSLVALWRGQYRLHGRINLVFFTLTLAALLILELLVRVVDPALFTYFDEHEELRRRLVIHLWFSVPAALLMPAMLYTGLTHRRTVHLTLAVIFSVLWLGTFITGIFFLPHTGP